MMKKVKLLGAVAALLVVGVASPVGAQGIPVFDSSSYLQALATVTNTSQMIQQGTQVIAQGQQAFNSFNKLTSASSVAGVLNDPNVRNLLPPEAQSVSTLLSGNTSSLGAFGPLVAQVQQQYGINQSYPQTTAGQATAQALANQQATAATAMVFGSNTLAIANQRTAGLTTLQSQLDTATDPKTALDLQVRATIENAQATNDLLKQNAYLMSKQADMQLKSMQIYYNGRAAALQQAQKNAQAYGF